MDVGKALRNTSKGRLRYDKSWSEDGRTKEVLDHVSEFSSNVAINISPKILSHVISVINQEQHLKAEENEKAPVTKPSPEKCDNKCKDSDTFFYELQAETELPILEYNEERLKFVQDIFRVKNEEYASFRNSIDQQIKQQYDLIKRNNELDKKRKAADLKKIEDAVLEEIKEREHLLKQHHQSQAKKLSSIVLEAELKQKKAEEELRKKEQEQKEFALQLNNCKLEAESSVLKAQMKLEACEHPSFLKISVSDRMEQMTRLLDDINSIVNGAKLHPLTIEDILNANISVKKTYETLQDVSNDIEHAKVNALQEHEKKLLESKEVSAVSKETNKSGFSKAESAVENDSSMKSVVQNQNVNKANEKDKNRIQNEAMNIISTFMAPDVVEEYHNIMETLKNTANNVQAFVEDPRNKKYRFELQKSINVPINAISSISGSHVRDKISRLLTILNAKSKENNNGSIAAYNFCANLIAKKFVEQGDKQISAQHSTAFPIALAVVGVWIKKPDVGSLILSHFYSNCPYLVPYYPPMKENQSNQEYYESLGYYFDKEGNMEPKYKFLNRMSGFMRLYAAILLAPVPPSSIKYPHPHGIAYGWKWLSRILNMDPRPDITATLLYDFLEVTGHVLQKTYGKQFQKLLHIICKDFFQKIKHITPSGSGGPVERLETFLQQTAKKKGYIPPPEGVLDAAFWNR